MENQKGSTINPLLINTSRQFYTRRIVQRSNSNVQLQKVLKILTQHNQKRSITRVKTQHRQQNNIFIHTQIDNLIKIARVKLQNLIKKQRTQWKHLYDMFDQFKKSTSIDTIKMNELKFLVKMQQIIKQTIKQQQMVTDRFRIKNNSTKIKDGKISLQNIKLSKQNEILRYQLQQLQNKENRIEIKKMINEKIYQNDNIQNMNKIRQQQYNELIKQNEYLKQNNNILRDEKKNYIQKINQLKNNNQNLCQEIIKIRSYSNNYIQKFQIWKNIMAMQNQEIISLKRDNIEIKKQYNDLYKKYQLTIKRINKINHKNQGKISQVTNKSLEIFTQQIQSFQRIRNNFINKSYYNSINNQKDIKDINLSIVYKKYMSDKDTLNNTEGIKKINKDYYRIYKPSFFVYLEKYFQYQGVDHQNFQQVSIAVGMHFLTTLRGILDSKYNQFLLAKNITKQFTSLPTFTISWLSNFKIDTKTYKKQQINNDVCFETIGSFYARLMNNQLNGNWQVITFRQFLLETLTIDQLAFYLKARFKLFNGDCLARSGAYLQIYYINYLDCLILIQEVVGDFDYRKKLEQYIKRSVQFQRKKQLIDAHFILRLLLEYYQYYKNKIFSTLSKTFSNYTKQRNTSMPFQSYLKIYDYNFFQINLTDKVQIFQKAFSLGRGVVYLQNIFTILNEEGYLCGQVDKIFSKHMVYQQTDGIIKKSDNLQPIEDFQAYYDKLTQKSLENQISLLGCQNIKQQSNKIKSYKNISYQIIIQRFQFLHSIAFFNLKKLFHSKKIKQAQLVSILPSMIKISKDILKLTLGKSENLCILEEYKRKVSAKAILKFYRKQKLSFNRSHLLATQMIDKINKTQQIRKQFTSLIDNIKKKYNSKNQQQTINQYQQID